MLELLVATTETIPCTATSALYLSGKIGTLVDGIAELDGSVLLRIQSLARRLDLKLDRFHSNVRKHMVSAFVS